MRNTPTASILDEIVDSLWGMPVWEMEEVLRRGAAAATETVARLDAVPESASAEEDETPFWLMVLAGEQRIPAAVPSLMRVLTGSAADELAFPGASAEALAKIGAPAVPSLVDLTRSGEPHHRIWGYGALGWIDHSDARMRLREALTDDPEVAGAVANALADQGDPTVIEDLAEALARAEPRQRPEIEDAIRSLYYGDREGRIIDRDWRLRYRFSPTFRGIEPSWPGIMALVRSVDVAGQGRELPARPIEEVLADREEEEPQLCECCGVAMWMGTGINVCPATAVAVPAIQHRWLGSIREEDEVEDLFEVLDMVENATVALLDEPEPRSRRERERQKDDLDRMRVLWSGCSWLIEQGVEDVGAGRARLLAEVSRAAQLHGDPEGILQGTIGAPPSTTSSPRVGRNEPCPCGSGRKYKKCCGRPDPAPDAPPSPEELPSLTNFDGEAIAFSRAHYRVEDEPAVRRALVEIPDLDPSPDADSFTWTQRVGEGESRVLGTVTLTRDRLTLECNSEARLERGRALLEGRVGRWLTHRADTSQDPYQAMAAMEAPGAWPLDSGMDPDTEAELIQTIQDRHYRSWPDTALPALGGATPREAAQTIRGRVELAELLSGMEVMEARKPTGHAYDFGWVWRELGIEGLRS